MNRSENKNNRQILVDKFTVPKQGKDEFIERMQFNRKFIKNLPGFVKDAVYQRTNEEGNFICITVAVWESAEALEQAKQSVQAKYEEEKFDPGEMFERLNITADRGVYTSFETT